MSEAVAELIVAEVARFGWGSKKILRRLCDAHPDLEMSDRIVPFQRCSG